MRPYVYVLVFLAVLAAADLVWRKPVGVVSDPVPRAPTDIATFRTAIKMFETDIGRYPATLGDLQVQPTNAADWRGPYLDTATIPSDPWGHAYVYRYPGLRSTNAYDLLSCGPDGREGTADDIPVRR